MSEIKFSIRNKSLNENLRVKIKTLNDSPLSVDNNSDTQYEVYIPNKKYAVCLSPSYLISCEGAPQNSGFLDISGEWALELNGSKVLSPTSLLDIISYLQNTGDFEVEVEDGLDFSDEFDYIVVTYNWKEGNGQDLDTRTSIIDPPRHIEVGWSRQDSDENYLNWAGDNTALAGGEAVLISIKELVDNFPSQATIKILLKAFWYSSVGDGRFSLNFKTYKGGTMSPDGDYNFINTDGALIDNFTFTCYTSSQDRAGVPLGTLDIDLINKKSTFTVLNSTDPTIQPPTNLIGVFSV